MYKLQDCFSLCGVFNDALIKRFKETYNPQKGSRIWMIPGHVIYTIPGEKVYTCDARPLDLLSPSEPLTGELLSTNANVLDIFFETENKSNRMYVALSNGDLQIFEYRPLLYEWARVGYFNLNIVSPNNSHNHKSLASAIMLSCSQGAVYWTEKTDVNDFSLNLMRRSVPTDSVRELTQTAIGTPQILLKNCPKFEFIPISYNICIVPQLPNSVNLYLILSSRCHLWVFDISGKCLWRGVIGDQPLDFISLCMKSVGLWSVGGLIKICKFLDSNSKHIYILHDNKLLFIEASGEITSSVMLDMELDVTIDYYVLWNTLCAFSLDVLNVYSIKSGKLVQVITLDDYKPVRGIWSHLSSNPCLGLYTDTSILILQPVSLLTLFALKNPCYIKALHILAQGNVHYFALMKDLVHHKLSDSDMIPLSKIPDGLQSKALLIALIQLCKERSIDLRKFPFDLLDLSKLLSISEETDTKLNSDTKLKKELEPLVQCYCSLEDIKKKLGTSFLSH